MSNRPTDPTSDSPVYAKRPDEGENPLTKAQAAPGGLPGDIDGDGDVDFADVSRALALMETGEATMADVTAILANFGAKEWTVPLTPWEPDVRDGMISRYVLAFSGQRGPGVDACERRYEAKRAPLPVSRIITLQPDPAGSKMWRNELMPRLSPVSDAPVGVVISGFVIGDEHNGLVSKVVPPRGLTQAGRAGSWLSLENCTIDGKDGAPVTVASVTEWGGGVWTWGCAFDDVQACLPGAMAHVGLDAYNIASDFLHNVRGAYDCFCDGIDKPTGSDLHPDTIQHSWTSDPGPVAACHITVRNARAQGPFVRSTAPIAALCLSKIDIEAVEDSGYTSQFLGATIGDLVIDGLRLRNQRMAIGHDGSRKSVIGRSMIRGLDIPPGWTNDIKAGFRADPTTGVVVRPEMFTGGGA